MNSKELLKRLADLTPPKPARAITYVPDEDGKLIKQLGYSVTKLSRQRKAQWDAALTELDALANNKPLD